MLEPTQRRHLCGWPEDLPRHCPALGPGPRPDEAEGTAEIEATLGFISTRNPCPGNCSTSLLLWLPFLSVVGPPGLVCSKVLLETCYYLRHMVQSGVALSGRGWSGSPGDSGVLCRGCLAGLPEVGEGPEELSPRGGRPQSGSCFWCPCSHTCTM